MSYTSKGSSTEIIIFSVIGVIVLIGIIVLVVFCLRRERRRRKKKTMPPPPTEISSKRYSDAERYKDGNLGLAATGTAAEMTPLKTVEGDVQYDDAENGSVYRDGRLLDKIMLQHPLRSVKL